MEKFNLGVSLVLGGARSGKSAFAEDLCYESGRKMVYVATSQSFDAEMDERINHHKSRRGSEWTLVEEPIDLVGILPNLAGENTCVLVDCLTLWLTNVMLADKDVDVEIDRLIECLKALPRRFDVILVSNEVGQGIVPMDKMARDFRDHAGRLHQKIAASSQNVWFITAGLSQKLK